MVREAISVCAQQERSLTEGLVLELHRMLLKDVPYVPGDTLKPGEFRGPTDDKRFVGFKYLKKHRPPPWRVRSDLLELLQDTESGGPTSDWGHAAGCFLYRFVRIHPFCEGNGRMARALSTLLLARDHPEVLRLEKPIDEVILEHRDDYIGVLEDCDGIYEDLKEEDLPEEEKLRWAERPSSNFYTRVFLRACHENDRKLPEGLEEKGVAARWPKIDRSVYEDLSPEAIKASHPWDETLKEAIVSRGET